MTDNRIPKTSEIMTHVDEAIAEHAVEERERYGRLEERLEHIEASITGMLEVWNGAKGVLAFLRWAAAIGAAVVAIMAWAKDHIKL